jgi:hypothetical protein
VKDIKEERKIISTFKESTEKLLRVNEKIKQD